MDSTVAEAIRLAQQSDDFNAALALLGGNNAANVVRLSKAMKEAGVMTASTAASAAATSAYPPEPAPAHPPVDPSPLNGDVVTVVVSDLHTPDERFDALQYISSKHDGARLVVAGDILNFDSASKFERAIPAVPRSVEHQMSAQQCLERAAARLAQVSSYWKDIVILKGNHDTRASRVMARGMNGDMSIVDEAFDRTFRDTIPNVKIERKAPWDPYMYKRGDAWIGHWNYHGKYLGGARKVIEWLLARPDVRACGEWNVVVQAHTHEIGCMSHLGRWAMECGALSGTPEYVDTSMGRGKVPALGYAILFQRDGVTVLEKSQVVPLDRHWYEPDFRLPDLERP